MKLSKFLEAHNHSKPELPVIQCDKLLYSSNDLSILNAILAQEIASKKAHLIERARALESTQSPVLGYRY